MTTPNMPDTGAPEQAWRFGTIREVQQYTEDSAIQAATNQPLSAFKKAQDEFHQEYLSAALINGQVVRLDNRIDNVEIGSERGLRYTYSESGVWDKHPAAYKVIVDTFGGSSPGTPGTRQGGGVGGFSGGWDHKEYTGSALENLPASVAVNVGAGLAAGQTGAAGSSSFGTFSVATGATLTGYGTGSRTYRMRGGTGAHDGVGGSAGSDGPFAPGGSRGINGSSQAAAQGGHGFSVGLNQVGPGSAGGGGGNYNRDLAWAGGPGGHGGWPSGPGGGGGASSWPLVDFNAIGGNGAGGMVVVTVLIADEFGVPPSIPTDLVASNIGSTGARVTWAASFDDIQVRHYVVYLNGARWGIVDALFHDFVSLSPATSYTVRVQAVDIGENASELSAPITFTTTA